MELTQEKYHAAKAAAKEYWRKEILPSIPSDGTEYRWSYFAQYWDDEKEKFLYC